MFEGVQWFFAPLCPQTCFCGFRAVAGGRCWRTLCGRAFEFFERFEARRARQGSRGRSWRTLLADAPRRAGGRSGGPVGWISKTLQKKRAKRDKRKPRQARRTHLADGTKVSRHFGTEPYIYILEWLRACICTVLRMRPCWN